jgi:hypothetical protein
MKVTLVLVFVALAAATALGYGSVESTGSLTAAAAHLAETTSEPAALLLSGSCLLGVACAVKRLTT